jgi:hypothetical protein
MDEEHNRKDLLKLIEERRKENYFWAKWNFITAQLFLWLAIVSSFLAAILTANGEIPKFTLALLVAIPGVVIVIDKTFSFSRRALWNMDNAAKYEQLYNQLKFEAVEIKEVSKKLAEAQLEMVENFPAMSSDWIASNNKPPKQ